MIGSATSGGDAACDQTILWTTETSGTSRVILYTMHIHVSARRQCDARSADKGCTLAGWMRRCCPDDGTDTATAAPVNSQHRQQPTSYSAHCKKWPYIPHAYFVASFRYILTEPVPCTFVCVNRRNNSHCNVGPRFIIPSIYGYERTRNRFR